MAIPRKKGRIARMISKKTLKNIAKNLLLIIVVVVVVSRFQARNLLTGGETAPSVATSTLAGGEFSLDQARGKKVLLYFFAPWCGVCKVSAGNLDWIRALFSEKGTEVVAVALDYQSTTDVREFATSSGIERIPVAFGSDEIRDDYKINAYPSYYVIDEEGKVSAKSVGYSTFLGMWFRLLF